MAWKLLLIHPSGYRSAAEHHAPIKRRQRSVVPLTLPYLAALTPSDWEVRLVDELLEEVPFDYRADLVAIHGLTANSYRAYDIAREFRARGARVVMGGPHVFFHGEEARQHVDAIGIGEAELTWGRMLADAAAGRLQPVYRAEELSDLRNLPLPRYDLLNPRHYGWMKTVSVQATRGCPFKCDFCAERLYLGGQFRCRPVADVVEEIKHCRSRLIFFAESNFGGSRRHALELMEALAPLKIRWSTLWSFNLCRDKEFLDLAQRSGLLHVNVGMESIDAATLAGMRKPQNQAGLYEEVLADLRRRGISYSLNFIFGWDTDTLQTFGATLQFLHEHKVPAAYFNVLTPEKGTAFYERMEQAGRLFEVEQAGRYVQERCHFQPAFCGPEALEKEVAQMYRQFYQFRSMLARLPIPTSLADFASWTLNFSERQAWRAKAANQDFDRY